MWYNFAVEWTLGASEDDGNFNFYYTEGEYDEDTKECILGFANEGSTPLTSLEEYVLRNEKKKTGACGINIYLDYEDSDSNLAGTTTVTVWTNKAVMGALNSFFLSILGLTYLI
mmetsp:Transcript_32703/g.31932  ORF Transcript_32703/g.31932 Transcript_32703/m.31932 type:complete len:114 (+) Transcript_32703:294-635(+)|eukprot:CAMPEP_0170542886 /NCGR_PEP_ID=MMETSP0211-20121228/2176_1 /TAXON_ID=311385 /ORGANISM="Pseudokeronopsis sp., Strain OXSARD2" /LENGTH=113 /DNA_ID=CAMNT_0010846095 /DNA_START=257 /DNA_END=598 /DNA_ORIENTATION=+